MSIVLGVDCGSRKTGYAFMKMEGNKPICIEKGLIKCSYKKDYQDIKERMKYIFHALEEVIRGKDVSSCGIEDSYVGIDPRASIIVSKVIGMVCGLCCSLDIPWETYRTVEIRKEVMGRAKASKLETYTFMRAQYNIKEEIADDVTDAIAVGTCHLYKKSRNRILEKFY